MTDYIVLYQHAWTEVWLCKASDEINAWKLFLARQYKYLESPDGTFQTAGEISETLNDVFAIYGIAEQDNGRFIDTEGTVFDSLDAVCQMYQIRPQNDQFISFGRAFKNLTELLEHLRVDCRIEIKRTSINTTVDVQQLFYSQLESDYKIQVGLPAIAQEHHLLAEMYCRVGEPSSAIVELEKALKLETRREKVATLHQTARLYKEISDIEKSLRSYSEALHLSNETDNQAEIMYSLAEVLLMLNRSEEAKLYYDKAIEEDPDIINDRVLRFFE